MAKKKDATKKDATKKPKDEKSETKKSAPKKSETKKSAPKKSAPKKSAPKKSSAKKSSAKKSSVTNSSPQRSAAKKPDSSGSGKSPSKSTRSNAATGDLPGTLERSPAKVQRTYEKTLASAEAGYGDEERAHRTAWGAVKNVAERRGDHWELKDSTGPSDPRSTKPAKQKRAGEGETYGGVDVLGNTRDQLVERAKKAGIRGTSRMTKAELGRQLSRHE